MIEVGSVVVLKDGSLGTVAEIFGQDVNVYEIMSGEHFRARMCNLSEHILKSGDRVQVQVPRWMVENGFNPVPNPDDQFGTVTSLTGRSITVQTKTRRVIIQSIYLRKI